MGTKKKNLPKYQFAGSGTPNSPNYDPGIGYIPAPYADAYTTSNAVVSPDLGDGSAATGAAGGGGMSGGMIASGVTAALNTAGDITQAFADKKNAENARAASKIDPSSVYAYDRDKSIWAKQIDKAETTGAVMGGISSGAASMNNPIGDIFAAGFGIGKSGVDLGVAEITGRDITGHNEIYKQRKNIGGSRGDFTTQGQFTTYEDDQSGMTRGKMGGYLDKYQNGTINSAYTLPTPKSSRVDQNINSRLVANGSKGGANALEQTRIINEYDSLPNDTSYIAQSPGFSYFYNTGQNTQDGKPVSNLTMPSSLKNTRPFAYGGPMKYEKGGMAVSNGVSRKYANAELEGGEIVEKPAGPDIYVKGPSHERGGVPMILQEGGPAQGGDYVWSDHLTYKGNTMAELYAMAVQNGASEQEIDQLRMLQEQLAGRAGDPQDAKELQEMPMAKTGGMLKKYQVGTNSRIFPDGTEMPVLSDSEYNRIMKEKQMKDLEALQNSDEYNEGMANLSWAPGSAANVALGKYGKLPSKEEVEREREMKRAADVQYYREQGLNSEGQPYSEEDLKSANVGEVGSGNLLSKTGTQIYGKRSAGDKSLELLPYGTAAAGMIAQLAATLAAKNPYKGIKTPSAALVSTPLKQFFERIDSRAEEAQNARGASLSKELLRQAGFGQGETAAVQKIELDRQAADAQATQRAREFNVSQDRAEKQLNTEMKLRSEMANQTALNERNMQEYQRMLSERGFETERGMNTADIVAGSFSDIGEFARDRTFAKAIEADSGVGQRAWNYDPVQARAEIMSENPQKDGESGSEYQSRINRLERENSKRYEEEYMRKVAERRRRYTQMRETDGEQS